MILNNTNKQHGFGKITHKFLLVLIASLLAGFPIAGVAANQMFFTDSSGIKGETEHPPYQNTIDVIAWSWGMANSASYQDGSGGTLSKAHIQDLNFVHRVDTTSPIFMKHVLTGQHLDEMVLIIQRPDSGKRGTDPIETMKIDMKGVLVTSVAVSASEGEDAYFENVTLVFQKVCVYINEINPDGTKGKEEKVCWDVLKNSP